MKKRKNGQGPEYKALCKQLKKECRRAKRRWLQSIVQEGEEAMKLNNSRQAYKLINRLRRKKTNPSLGIKDKQGRVLGKKTF